MKSFQPINSLLAMVLAFTLRLELIVYFIVVDFLHLVSVHLVVLSSIPGDSTGAYHLSQLASQTGHFENEISFFGEFLQKKSSRYAYYVEMN